MAMEEYPMKNDYRGLKMVNIVAQKLFLIKGMVVL